MKMDEKNSRAQRKHTARAWYYKTNAYLWYVNAASVWLLEAILN